MFHLEGYVHYRGNMPYRVWYSNKRLLSSLNVLKTLEDLELYLTFTDHDLGLIGCNYHRPSDPYQETHLVPVLPRSNQDFSKILISSPGDLIAGKQCFSIYHASKIVRQELFMLTNSHHPFNTISSWKNENKETCIKIMKKVDEALNQVSSYNRSNMGCYLSYEHPRRAVSSIMGPYNEPCWDSEDEKLELLFSSDGTIASGILPANISTVVLKVWRMYFTLLEHMNHPTCRLTGASMNFDKKILPLQSPYFLVAKDWARFGINI